MSRQRSWALAAAAAALMIAVNADQGGYFATSWGWIAAALLLLTATAVVVGRSLARTPLLMIFVTGLVMFVGWGGLSALWSLSAASTIRELERNVVYVSAALLLLVVGRRSLVPPLLAGTLVGIVAVCSYALATRLLPDRLGVYDATSGYRLSEPVGYWNGLGLLAAIGVIVALSFAARGARPQAQALSAMSLLILVPTLYFTFSRGSWIALAAGLAVAIAVDPRRLQLLATALALAPAPALGVWIASKQEALTHESALFRAATQQGHHLALVLLALAPIAAALAVLVSSLSRRALLSPRTFRASNIALGVIVVVSVVATVAAYGGPVHLAERAGEKFAEPLPVIKGDLNARLFSLSGTGRQALWRVAWDDTPRHPLIGSGAGTFEPVWYERRRVEHTVRDAHSLYLETLAELGVVGLALLAGALGAPLVAGVRARRLPLVPPALGAYTAYLAHAGADWDWELAGVTLLAIIVGGACLASVEPDDSQPVLGKAMRGVVLFGALAVSAFALVSLVGNQALVAGREALGHGNLVSAERQAKLSARLLPWSPDPWVTIGDAQLASGDTPAAQRSYKRAIGKDPGNWLLWRDLAQATVGAERRRAIAKVILLNPLNTEFATNSK